MSETTAEERSALVLWRVCSCEEYGYSSHPPDCPHEIAKRVVADLGAAEDRAQKAEARVKVLEEALGGQHTTRIVEDAIASADQNKTKDQRAYAVRVLEAEADRLEKITDDQEAAWEAAGLYEHETSDLDPWCLRNLADRIKAVKA